MGTSTKTFYLDPPQLIGRPNSDGTVTLTPLELKKLNDYNYAVAKLLQGNLNLANLNAETNEVFTDMDGNITTISATADGLAADISNLEGNITTISATADGLTVDVSNLDGDVTTLQQTASGLTTSVSNLNTQVSEHDTDISTLITNVSTVTQTANGLTSTVSSLSSDVSSLDGSVSNLSSNLSIVSHTVDGLSIADETGSYTIIDGDKLKSKDYATAAVVQIENGMVKIANGNSVIGYMTYYNNNLYIFGDELLLNADGSAVIEGTNIRLGTNAETSNLYLKGNIYLNENQSLADYILAVVGS